MSTFTPRGLKIHLDRPITFALMARLYPKVDAWKVLKTTEALEQLPSACCLIVAALSIANGLNIDEVSAFALLGSLVGSLLKHFDLVDFPGVIPFANLCNVFPFFSIPWAILIIYGLYEYSWGLGGVLTLGVAKLLAFGIDMAIGFFRTQHLHSVTGRVTHASKRNFFHSYKYYAEQIGVTISLKISREEMMEDNWRACFMDLAHNHPGRYLEMSE